MSFCLSNLRKALHLSRLSYENCLILVENGPMTITYIRLGKTRSLGPCKRVMVHRRKPSLCHNDAYIGGSFWHSESFLRCTMTLLQGPKDPWFAQPNLYTGLWIGN